MTDTIQQLSSLIDACMLRDQHRLRMALRRLSKEQRGQKRQKGQQERKGSERLRQLEAEVQSSIALREQRRQALPAIHFPAELPVSGRAEEIAAAIEQHQVVVIAGETGSGKTTQIPKICLSIGRGVAGRIGHTQPRRLAARSVAARIAEELKGEVGREVGCQIRFSDSSSEATYIKLMTDGILLAEIQQDPWLNQYDTIIIDEAHERSLNIDFLLGYLRQLLPKRPGLKLIITSATIDVDKFSRHFGRAPVLEVSGRTYPVEVLYRPPEDSEEEPDLPRQVELAVEEILQRERKKPLQHSDVLVFLSGEKQIRDVALALRKAAFPHTEILPLYARLSNAEQNRVFQPHTGRRIVLSTNVAETSLTVPGIGYVIDAGTARISRYSVRSKVQRLPVEAVSQASANQRAGRCGRLGSGVCIRLYSEEDFQGRPEFTDTEITRTHLGSVILQMLSLRLGDIEQFPFVDKPDPRAVRDGFRLLEELGAINDDRGLSRTGRQMARLPVDPKFGRMILEAAQRACLKEMLIIVSALSIQDPRERPMDKQQAADEKHGHHAHPESDFVAFVNLWNSYEEGRQALTQSQLRKYCQKHFLSWMRMREWREVHRQLQLVCRDLRLNENRQPASYEDIHKALLSGLLGQVATRMDDGVYLGARNRKFQLFPGSVLFRKKSRWVLAAELVETTQLYARMNARIEPEWVEELAPAYLLKKEYAEPHWSRKRGRVMAWEKVSLYGLVLVEKRLVAYGKIDPAVSREIFVRDALVGLQLNTRLAFYSHNRKLIEEVRSLEDKTRRRDLLVDEQQIADFYLQHLPEDVLDVRSLEQWYGTARKQDPRCLFMDEQALMREQASGLDLSQFPDQLSTPSLSLPLDYQFEPGKHSDGVSVTVPLVALKQLREESLDWLVPGMLREKCIALVKALPKVLRKNFVPVPDYVERVLPRLKPGESGLQQQLAQELSRLAGTEIALEHWQNYELPLHLQMNINVVDDDGRVIGQGRELRQLQRELSSQVQTSLERQAEHEDSIECRGLTDWSFETLPEVYEIERGGLRLQTWPALVCEDDGTVALKLLDSAWRARQLSQVAMTRLLKRRTPQQLRYLQKNLLQNPASIVLLKALGERSQVLDNLIDAAYLQAFELENSLPRDREAFNARCEQGKPELIRTGEKLEQLLFRIMEEYAAVHKALKRCTGQQMLALHQDVLQQLQHLVYPGFIRETPLQWLNHFPRFLKAIQLRLERYPLQPDRDRQWQQELQLLWNKWRERRQYCDEHELVDEGLDHYRWMLEEYRVSLFAQQLGTSLPVSAKRLDRQWQDFCHRTY